MPRFLLRLCWILCAVLLACCGRSASETVKLPPVVAAEWRLQEQRAVAPEAAPAPMQPAMIESAAAGVYTGPERIEVTHYRLKSSALGLDMMQRWRPAADTVFFYKDENFVTVHWSGASRERVRAFVTDYEKALAK